MGSACASRPARFSCRAAEAGARGARADLATLRRETITRIASAYYRLQYVVAAQATLAAQRRLLATAVEISTARYATGTVPQSDPLNARTALVRLQTDSADLAAEEESIRAELRAVRGRRELETLEVIPVDPSVIVLMIPDSNPPPAHREQLPDHPRLQSRAAEVAAADYTARAAMLQGRPDFVLTPRYGARPLGADFFSAFVGIRVPLWAGRKQRLLAEAARSEALAAQSRLEEERSALEAERDRTSAGIRASLTRLRLLQQQVVPLTRETVEAALREYRTGLVGFISVLTAQDAAYRAELEAADAAARYLTQLVMLEQLLAPEGAP